MMAKAEIDQKTDTEQRTQYKPSQGAVVVVLWRVSKMYPVILKKQPPDQPTHHGKEHFHIATG